MTPKVYQEKILNEIEDKNSIIYAETGRGKTFISIMLMTKILKKEKTQQTVGKKLTIGLRNPSTQNQSIKQPPKIFFLVPENSLLEQQYNAISSNIGDFKVTKFLSGKIEKFTNCKREFELVIKINDVFVCTPEIMYRFLYLGFLNFSSIRLLVFDECHHTDLNHPYNIIMNEFYFFYKINYKDRKLPQILGLTASPFKRKFNKIDSSILTNELAHFCENMDCVLVMDPDIFDYKFEVGNDEIDKISPGEARREYIQISKFSNHKHYDEIVTALLKNLFQPLLQLSNLEDKKKKEFLQFIYILFSCDSFQDFGTKLNEFNYLMKENESNKSIEMINILVRQIFLLFDNTNLNCIIMLLEDYKKEYKYPDQKFKIFFAMINFLKDKDKLTYESDRILELKEYLLKIFTKDSYQKNRIIIFVDHRVVSNYLVNDVNMFLNLHFNNDNSNNKFQALNIVGVSSGKKSIITVKNTISELNNKLNLFNIGIYQVLIATSTVEEGIDIKDCDIVIVYTELKTIKSYIQMKGRARKSNAEFVMFSNNIEETLVKIKGFVDVIKLIRGKFVKKSFVVDLRRKNFLDKKTIDKIFLEIPTSNAKITIRNAPQIYNHLKNLFFNKNVKLEPKIKYDEKIRVKDIEPKWKCYFDLSNNSVDFNFESDYYVDKGSSLCHVYILFIKSLYEYDVIDEFFNIQDLNIFIS